MSACISQHGEYSSHEPDSDFRCKLCGVLDEDTLIERVKRAEAVIAAIKDAEGDTTNWAEYGQTVDRILATYQNGADQ